ncbi:hypothetical protein PMIN06_003133 [Paraphaeosphaeria minitans]|uniref:Uncharacterized protein n=1 Tax=Paraphaeosphaeria minitans TaxID=565426 RepID=A0A9P6GA53_9PLEO|nr:hypothetical protein PMIN01_10433 [Paraphaeosphaeria minitans]
MRVPLLAALLGSGLNAVASPDGPDDKGSPRPSPRVRLHSQEPVTALSKDAPAYVVGPNVYSTSTLYTTSYFTITECASNAVDCPTNALNVVTSAVFATTTTTICLTSGLPTPTALPEGSATASLTVSVSVGLPSATGTLPSTAVTSANPLPSGSGFSPAPDLPITSSHGILPIPSSGIPIGPGPVHPSGSGLVPASGSPSTSGQGNSPTPSSGNSIGPGPALPSNWLPSIPSGSGFASSPGSPGSPTTSSIGHLPVPNSGIPIGPGPVFPSQSLSAGPSGSAFVPGLPAVSGPSDILGLSTDVPVGSGIALSSTALYAPSRSGFSSSFPGVSASVPSAPLSSGSYVPIPGASTVTVSGAPPASYSLGPEVPPRPRPSAWAPLVPASNSPSTSASYTGSIPNPGSGGPSSGVSQVPTATGSSNGYPSASGSGFPGSPSGSSPIGTPFNPKPTAIPSGSGFIPGETGTEGTKTSSLASSPIGHPNVPATPSGVTHAPGLTSTIPSATSSVEEGTSTTQVTSIVTYSHTTFIVTVPVQTISRNYSTETAGIHTSIGTDASAYFPTGTGWWPSATANGTVISPTPSSPIPINNEGQHTFGSGKSSIVAIVVALAFAHFAQDA